MAGGLGPAYDQTDVMHDRSYLINQLLNPNKRVREQAEVALADLNRQEALNQRDYALGLREQENVQSQINFEANQRRMSAHQMASELDRQLKIDRDTEIDEQGHGLLQSMMKLHGALRRKEITKDQYDDGLLEAGELFPLGTRHPEAARHYEFAITEADKQNAFNLRRELNQAARLGAKYGIEPQIDPETGRPSIQLTQQAALQTPKGKNEALKELNTEMQHKYGITTGVGSLFNPVAPHVGTDEAGQQVAENPTHIGIPFVQATGEAAGQVGRINVPAPLFEQMKTDFGDRYFALNPPSSGAQPAGAVPGVQSTAPAANPRSVLAQRALDDPTASEAHKAAARKILGQE